jgi:trehalose 6-phosphate synthase
VRAVLVNPHDIDGLAVTIARANARPRAEQTRRMRSLRQRVRRRTVYDWADDFIAALSGTDAGGLAVRKPAAVPSGDSR